jgi:hypothetical protein
MYKSKYSSAFQKIVEGFRLFGNLLFSNIVIKKLYEDKYLSDHINETSIIVAKTLKKITDVKNEKKIRKQ